MKEMMAFDRFAMDKQSVRHLDENGFLHVDISPVTREQVAPYYGHEIPNYKDLGFESDEIYHGYRSADELKRPETITSLNGIPIQFEHHADYADDPAKNTRVGATGTDAQFKAPYLTNSLHFYDQKAIDHIEDGSMKELSLGYRYTPIKKSGEWNGQKYDFLMTDISCNHLALVEEGRAGREVCVGDSQLKPNGDKPMDDPIEKVEVGLAQAIIDLHEQTPDDRIINKNEGAPKGMDSMNELLEALKADGIDITKYQKFIDDQPAEDEDLADKEDPAEDVDEIIEEPEDDDSDSEADKTEDEDLDELDGEDGEDDGDSDEEDAEAEDEDDCDKEAEDEDETEEDDRIIEDALKECGLEDADPAVKKAFARGFKFEASKDKDDTKKELGQDHALVSMGKKIERSLASRFDAAEECAGILGRVKPMAFDSAGSIYRAALTKMGVKGAEKMKSNEARSVFRYARANERAQKIAEDKAIRANGTAVSNILNKIKIGV